MTCSILFTDWNAILSPGLRTRKSSSEIDYENTWSRTGKQEPSLHLSPLEATLEARACAG